VLLDRKAPFYTIDDAGMDAPAPLPRSMNIHVGLLGEEFSDGFDVEFGIHLAS
jgi:hypothetical protein